MTSTPATDPVTSAVSLFAAIAETADDAFVAVDDTQTIVVCNPAARSLFRYELDDIIGQPLNILLPPRIRDTHADLVSGFRSDPMTWRSSTARRPVTARRSDGTEFQATITILKTPNTGQTVYGAIVRDITGLEEAQALLTATFHGTAAVTGPAFFDKSVKILAEALDVHTVFVSVPVAERPGWNRLIAHWSGGAASQLIQYERLGTPCELATSQELVSITDNVQQQFPDDEWLASLDASSYVALRLVGNDGTKLGHLGVVDTAPGQLTEDQLSSLRIFGSRIAAEVDRVRSNTDREEQVAFRSNILDSAPFGFTHRNLITGALQSNAAFERIVGRTYQECREVGWDGVIHPDDLDHFNEQSDRLRTSGNAEQAMFRIVHPDGGVRWLQRHGAAKLSPTGEPVEILTLAIDLTETHRANAELLAAVSQLDARNAEINGSLDAYPDIRFRLSENGTYLDVQAGDPTKLIVPADQLLGTKVGDHFEPALTARILEAIQTTVETTAVTSVEYRIGDGADAIHCEARIAPLPDRQVMAVVRDISHLKALEAQLIHAGTMQSVGRLAGGIAHDFNNVLHIIRGHASALQREVIDQDSIEHRVDSITRAVDRTASLIERLMTISRPPADEPASTVVDDIVRGLGPPLKQLLGEAIALDFSLDAPDVAVLIDDSRLEAAILNLVGNASDAMPDGGILRVTTEVIESVLRLTVSDTGAGMEEDVAAHIFEPFFTTKPAGVGTGLGLATTFNSIAAAGGTISVSSDPGVGTTFIVDLPTTDLAPGSAAVGTVATVSTKPGSRILVVEDEPDVLELCADALTGLGYQVLRATNGSDALALAELHAPIAGVLTDIIMPDLSGPEFAQQLTSRFPGTPIVYMSGYSPDTIAADIPPELVLRKPFTEADLRDILVTHIP